MQNFTAVSQSTNNNPPIFDAFNPFKGLAGLGMDMNEIEAKVSQDMEAVKSKTFPEQEFFNDVGIFEKDNGVDSPTAMLETLKYYKNKGYLIEGVDIDKEIDTLTQEKQYINESNIENIAKAIGPKKESLIKRGIDVIAPKLPLEGILPGVEEAKEKMIGGITGGSIKAGVNLVSAVSDLLGEEDSAKLIKDLGYKTRDDIYKDFEIDPEGTYAKVSEGLVGFGLTMIPTPAGKIEIFDKSKKLLKSIENLAKFVGFGAKGEAIMEGEITKEGAMISAAIPLAFKGLEISGRVVKTASPGIIRFVARKLPGVDVKVIQAIEDNPGLTQKLLKGEITEKELEIQIKKVLPDIKLVKQDFVNLKNKYTSIYDDVISKGKVSEDGVLSLVDEKMAVLESERAAKGATIGEFKTGDKVITNKELMSEIDAIRKSLGITGAKEGFTGKGSDAAEAAREVYIEYSNIIGKSKNITAEQLQTFNQTIQEKVNFVSKGLGKKSNTYQNILKKFSKKIDEVADKPFGTEYAKAQESFKSTMDSIKDFKVLLTKGEGTPKQNLRSTIKTLTQPNNKEKLATYAKAFGTDETKFVQYLKDIDEGVEATKIVKQISKQTSIGQFLNNLQTKGIGTNRIPQDISNKIQVDLDNLLVKENMAKLREVITGSKYGGTQINIASLTEPQINAIKQADATLGEIVDISNKLASLKTAVGLTGGMKAVDLAKIAVFKSPDIFANLLLKFELALRGTQKYSNAIKQKLSMGKELTSDEKELLEELFVKMSIASTFDTEDTK